VTTTPVSCAALCVSVKSWVIAEPVSSIDTVLDTNPMRRAVSDDGPRSRDVGTVNEYRPSASVVAPSPVVGTVTLAPWSGAFPSVITRPEMVVACCA
jgi:hypothetical protein